MMSGCHPFLHFLALESRGLSGDIRQAFLAMQKWVRYRPGKLRASTPASSLFSAIGPVART
ncbi:MAG TPA: hypothetical protein VGO51_10060 [Burkholderiaceae bacterium]|nr:hypothetical protein [Burkholderiaceae bacterium]